MNIDVSKVRQDFPLLQKTINGKPISYLDSTASSLKPKIVLDAINRYYSDYGVNIFRGVYKLSEKATLEYENARSNIAQFIGSESADEIIFVRGATEGINLVAATWGSENIDSKSEIVSTVMEHHANLIPWQQLVIKKKALIKFLDFDDRGIFNLDDIEKVVTKRTKLFTITYVSNVLGTINPIKRIIALVKKINPKTLVLIDAAQAVPHMKVDVKDINCDFLVFSAHKMCGPTGVGILWGKKDILQSMPPFQTGGDMIKEVYLDRTIFNKVPYKFEAGTPHIAGGIGLSAAVDYLKSLGLDAVKRHERDLVEYAILKLNKINNLSIYGPIDAKIKAGVIAFNVTGIHPHDMAQVLDEDNVCIRSGHHCAMPLHTRLKIGASCRASFYIYNTRQEVDRLIRGIEKAKKLFRV